MRNQAQVQAQVQTGDHRLFDWNVLDKISVSFFYYNPTLDPASIQLHGLASVEMFPTSGQAHTRAHTPVHAIIDAVHQKWRWKKYSIPHLKLIVLSEQ